MGVSGAAWGVGREHTGARWVGALGAATELAVREGEAPSSVGKETAGKAPGGWLVTAVAGNLGQADAGRGMRPTVQAGTHGVLPDRTEAAFGGMGRHSAHHKAGHWLAGQRLRMPSGARALKDTPRSAATA